MLIVTITTLAIVIACIAQQYAGKMDMSDYMYDDIRRQKLSPGCFVLQEPSFPFSDKSELWMQVSTITPMERPLAD
jgi:hypothetical protein